MRCEKIILYARRRAASRPLINAMVYTELVSNIKGADRVFQTKFIGAFKQVSVVQSARQKADKLITGRRNYRR